MSGGKGYYQAKGGYNDFCKATFALEGLAKGKSWPLYLAVGPDSHLIYRAALKFKSEVKKAGWKASLLDVEDVTGDVLRESVQGWLHGVLAGTRGDVVRAAAWHKRCYLGSVAGILTAVTRVF